MVVGRVDLNLMSTKSIYQDAHFGTDSWLSVGWNGSYQGSLKNAAGDEHGSNAAGGVDAMVDVPAGPVRLFSRGEANVIKQDQPGPGNPVDTWIWMLAGGVLVSQRLQPLVRFDEIHSDDGGVRDITYVGANWYQQQHTLKVQADVRFESGTSKSLDGGRLQAQLDF